jgi:hypothetical protein
MSPSKRWLAVFSLWFLCCIDVFAQIPRPVIRVPAEYPTIQSAINAAGTNSTVLVAPGTYIENIDFLGKGIELKSEQGPQVTILDGNQTGPVLSILVGSGEPRVTGFTIRNGSAFRGGGIRLNNTIAYILGNIITGNIATDGGAAISSVDSVPIVQGNIISNNRQAAGFAGGAGGGAVHFTGLASGFIENNAIFGNSWATGNGGAISVVGGGRPTLRDNIIINNTAIQGGAISALEGSVPFIFQNIVAGNSASFGGGVYWLVPPTATAGPWLINNTITDNLAQEGSAIFADGFAHLINNLLIAPAGQNAVTCSSLPPDKMPIFQSNDVMSASGLAYSGGCTNQTGLNGNISLDPLFRNAAAGDYHLLNGSPAIDAAVEPPPAFGGLPKDLDGVSRPADGNGDAVVKYDMGVYEVPLFDPVPPVTLLALTPSPNSAGWNRSNVLVTLTAADGTGSGIYSIRYSLSGAHTASVMATENPVTVTLTTEGSTTVEFAATDNAGNVESSRSATVSIDRTPPVIAGMPDEGCTLSPPKHQLVQVATITASDSNSGLADLTITGTSSEPDSGQGGSDDPGDIVIIGGTVQLRSEKSPSSKIRTYTLVAAATDVAGNTSTSTATCKVTK